MEEALQRAQRWCREREATVSWEESEARCRIRVQATDGAKLIEGVGAGLYEAYVACRVRFDASGPDGPPSWF
jgi:hypothetical protein